MFKILAIIAAGIVTGYLLRSERTTRYSSKVLNITIYVLLLSFGIGVGANKTIIENIDTIGLKALLIAIATILGSCIVAKFIERKLYKSGSDER